MTISLRIDGTPKPQPRPRAFVRRTALGPVARVYDAGTAEAWKAAIAMAVRAHRPSAPIDTPTRVFLRFAFPRPKRLARAPHTPIPHIGRPDLDNLAKAVFDALTDLGFWTDDGVIQGVEARKWYVAAGELPGLEMRIEWDEPAARRGRAA